MLWAEGILTPEMILEEEFGKKQVQEWKVKRPEEFKIELERVAHLFEIQDTVFIQVSEDFQKEEREVKPLNGHLNLLPKTLNRFDPEVFHPKKWVQKAERIETDGRKFLWKFPAEDKRGKAAVIYAKSPRIDYLIYQTESKPPYFLSELGNVTLHKASYVEMRHLYRLRRYGVFTEQPLGFFSRGLEQYLFTLEAKGENPESFLKDSVHRKKILDQDALMLAGFCRARLRKFYFPDWEDKLYDGERLRLIDADEVDEFDIEFKTVIAGQKHKTPKGLEVIVNLHEMRIPPERWSSVYLNSEYRYRLSLLKDVLKTYSDQGLISQEDMKAYAKTFFLGLGYSTRAAGLRAGRIVVEKDRVTQEQMMSMMSEV